MTGARVHLIAIRSVCAVLVVVGFVLAGMTLAQGGGGLARGVVLGVLLAAAGAGRLLLTRDRSEQP